MTIADPVRFAVGRMLADPNIDPIFKSAMALDFVLFGPKPLEAPACGEIIARPRPDADAMRLDTAGDQDLLYWKGRLIDGLPRDELVRIIADCRLELERLRRAGAYRLLGEEPKHEAENATDRGYWRAHDGEPRSACADDDERAGWDAFDEALSRTVRQGAS